jgi:hypothetical protein
VLGAATDAELGFYVVRRRSDDDFTLTGKAPAVDGEAFPVPVVHLVVAPGTAVVVVSADHPVVLALVADGCEQMTTDVAASGLVSRNRFGWNSRKTGYENRPHIRVIPRRSPSRSPRKTTFLADAIVRDGLSIGRRLSFQFEMPAV